MTTSVAHGAPVHPLPHRSLCRSPRRSLHRVLRRLRWEGARGSRGWLIPAAFGWLAGSPSPAQVQSPGASVRVTVRKTEHLTVTPTVNAMQAATGVVDGAITSFGPGPVGITTRWDVQPGQTGSIRLVGYFMSAQAALVNSDGNAIAPGEIEARMTTVAGMAWMPFTAAPVTAGTALVGTPGASLLFWTVPISGINKVGTRDDQLALRLNLIGRTGVLPVGAYTGTLYLRAIAY